MTHRITIGQSFDLVLTPAQYRVLSRLRRHAPMGCFIHARTARRLVALDLVRQRGTLTVDGHAKPYFTVTERGQRGVIR